MEHGEHDTVVDINSSVSDGLPVFVKKEPDMSLDPKSSELCLHGVKQEYMGLNIVKIESLTEQHIVSNGRTTDHTHKAERIGIIKEEQEEEWSTGWEQNSDQPSCELLHVKTEPDISNTDDETEDEDDGEFTVADAQNEEHRRKHTRMQHNEDAAVKRHLCKVCGKAYVNRGSLTIHMRRHTGKKPYRCQTCGKSFDRSDSLTDHESIHTGERRRKTKERIYACDQCDMKFSKPAYLNTHLRRHAGDRPFPCDQCEKKFFTLCDLKRHQRQHTGERPYTCTECGKMFNRTYILKKHLRTHSVEKPYFCTQCGKSFRYIYSLKLHMKVHGE